MCPTCPPGFIARKSGLRVPFFPSLLRPGVTCMFIHRRLSDTIQQANANSCAPWLNAIQLSMSKAKRTYRHQFEGTLFDQARPQHSAHRLRNRYSKYLQHTAVFDPVQTVRTDWSGTVTQRMLANGATWRRRGNTASIYAT